MKKFKRFSFVFIGALAFPLFAFAQAPKDLTGLICLFLNILKALIPLLVGMALVAFLWGVAKFISNAEDTSKHADGRQLMIYGLIGLFVMLSVWGLVGILGATFGVQTVLPQLTPGSGGGGGSCGGGGLGGFSGSFSAQSAAESLRNYFDGN